MNSKMIKDRASVYWSAFLLFVFPLPLALCFLIYKINRDLLIKLFEEDGFFNILTVLFWLLASFLFFLNVKTRRIRKEKFWFVLFLSVFCLYAALDEQNWFQRQIKYDTPQFISSRVGHKEMSVHYILTGLTGVDIERLGGGLVLLYGIVLPIIASLSQNFRDNLRKFSVVISPLILIPGFFISGILGLYHPTGTESELAEFFASLLFALISFVLVRRIKLVKYPKGILLGAYCGFTSLTLVSSVFISQQEIAYRKSEAFMRAGRGLIQKSVEARDIASLASLVQQGVPLQGKENDWSSLISAVNIGDVDTVQWLIKYGAEINYQDREGKNPLSLAIAKNNLVVVKILLQNGADPNFPQSLPISEEKQQDNKAPSAPLITAVKAKSYELVDLLLKAKADVNAIDADGNTAIFYAAQADDFKIAFRLLEQGANIAMKNRAGISTKDLISPSSRLAVLLGNSLSLED